MFVRFFSDGNKRPVRNDVRSLQQTRHPGRRPTSLAYERTVFTEDPATARTCFDIRDSITNRSFPLVRKSYSTRVPPASTALARAGETRRHFGALLSRNFSRLSLAATHLQIQVHVTCSFSPFIESGFRAESGIRIRLDMSNKEITAHGQRF